VQGFVDVHSHAVPSGDDGVRSIEEAVELCELARAGGTRVLFATPHAHAAWDRYPLTLERERLFEEALPLVSRVVSAWGLDLRRGFEVFPTVLRDRDPHEFLLEGTRAVLLEFPGSWLDLAEDSSLVLEAADRLLAVELVPVIAHPERSLGLGLTSGSRERSSSVLPAVPERRLGAGRNGPVAEQAFWRLLDEGLVALVASDGHSRQRPPRLDQAHRLLVERREASIEMLFDGSAIPWIGSSAEPAPSPGSTSALRCRAQLPGYNPNRLCAPHRTRRSVDPAAATSACGLFFGFGFFVLPILPGAASFFGRFGDTASLLPWLSVLRCLRVRIRSEAPSRPAGRPALDTDRQTQPARARSHRLPGRRRRS
jgi:protein-tyrosine phosphatase